jgi:aminoglycoside phosphotransferase (APT) family kinase protein
MKGKEELQPSEQVLSRLLTESPKEIRSVSGGANNRVWEVKTLQGKYLLKQYFRSTEDSRDRFASEKAFYTYAQSKVPGKVPQVQTWDPEGEAGLFCWVEGRKLTEPEVTGARVQEAFEFFAALNRLPLPTLSDLPSAAEAAWTMCEHLDLVNRRIERLQQICGEDSEAEEARHLVREKVIPAWERIFKKANQEWPEKGRGTHRATACVSPSDFGFHNSLLGGDGRLRFFDFEYAGWDDPAKMAADFFCQPRVPAPAPEFPRVAALLAELFPQDAEVAERATSLWPVYRMKWICIMLNEFLPAGKTRRGFSLGEDAQVALRRQRLEAVRSSLEKVNSIQ